MRDSRLAFLAPAPLAGHGIVLEPIADRPKGNVTDFEVMLGVGWFDERQLHLTLFDGYADAGEIW